MGTLVHVGIRASNLEHTIRFWRDGLGLQVVGQEKDSYDLTDGYHNFRIFQHGGDARPAHVSGMLEYLHLGISVPDLAVAAERLLEMGYDIYSDGLGGKTPADPDNLQEKAFKVADPDGITVDVNEAATTTWPGVAL
jgi:catechol 2,3-dioxygenase-like lactoylglutathione lyase family enzyme